MMEQDSENVAERSDAELIGAARAGDSAAFATLFARHSEAARGVARIYARDGFSADDLVSEAFARTMAAIQGGHGPDVSFRAYLYTTLRNLAGKEGERDRRTLATDDFSAFEAPEAGPDPDIESFEKRVVGDAFASLPERWQAVLWYLEVERMPVAEIAPILGLTPNGVSALGFRAREGLRQAYLQQHVAPAPEGCEAYRSRLGGYARGALSKRENAVVEGHLEGCAECRVILAELRDVGRGMRVVIAPLVLGGAAAGALLGAGGTPSASAATLPRVRLRARRIAAAAAAVVVLAGAAVAAAALIGGGTEGDETAAPPVPSPSASAPATPSPQPSTTASPTAPEPDPEAGPEPAPRPDSRVPVPPVVTSPPPTVPTVLSVALEDTGDLVLGRSGMVGVVVGNPGTTTAAEVTLRFSLPSGVSYDPSRAALTPLPSGWACVSTSCSVSGLAAGTSVTVRLPLTVDATADTTTPVAVTARAGGRDLASATASAPVRTDGLGARLILDGRYTIRQAGASFLGCDPTAAGCAEASARSGPTGAWNNNSWAMQARASSVTDLTLPSGSTVVFAGLYWSGYVPTGATDASLSAITLLPPGAASPALLGAARTDRTTLGLRESYQSFADVTSLVASAGSGAWTASGAQFDTGPDSFGGWALVVVLRDDTLAPARIAVFDGLATIDGSTPASFDVAVLAGAQATLGVVAWEGDAATSGDALLVDGEAVTPLGGLADPGNAFDSTADGFADANSFGVDVKRFQPRVLSAARASLTATTAGDAYLVGVVTVESR